LFHRSRHAFQALLLTAFFSAVSSPALAQNVQLEQLTIGSAGTTIVLKGLEIEGSSLPAETLRQLGTSGDFKAVAEAVGRLSAKTVRAASIESVDRLGKDRSIMVMEGVSLSDVRNGRAAAGTVAKGRFTEESNGETTMTGTFGTVRLRDADIAFGLALQAPGSAGSALRPVYASVEVTAIEVAPQEGGRIIMDRVAAEGVAAKPLAKGWAATIEGFAAAEDFETLSPSDRSVLVRDMERLFSSFAIGRLEMLGIRASDGSDDAMIGRLLFEGASASRGPALTLDNVSQASGTERVAIERIRFADWSIDPFLKGLVAAYGDPGKTVEPSFSTLMPAFGRLEIRNVSVRGMGSPLSAPAAMRSLEMRIDNPEGGIPRGMRLAFDGLSAPLDPADAETAELRALGYASIDVSGVFDIAMRGTDELEIKEISFRGADMADVRISSLLGNVRPIMNAASGEEAFLSALAVTVKRLEMTLENRGLAERIAAKESGGRKSPDQVRNEARALAALTLPPLLGSSPGARALTGAVLQFMGNPKRLTVSARSKNTGGIGAAEAAMITKPADAFALMDVEARAD
jgi:hypothetical protein